jgi:hypothetical protein
MLPTLIASVIFAFVLHRIPNSDAVFQHVSVGKNFFYAFSAWMALASLHVLFAPKNDNLGIKGALMIVGVGGVIGTLMILGAFGLSAVLAWAGFALLALGLVLMQAPRLLPSHQ